MNIILELIKVDKSKLLLRPINILLIFLPAFLIDKIKIFENTYFLGGWSICFLVIFFIQTNYLNAYKIIGQIKFNENLIEVKKNNENPILFKVFERLSICIEYNGFKGEKVKISNPLFIPIGSKDGIGELEIASENGKFRYKFLSEKNYYNAFIQVLNAYKKEGCKVDLRT